MGTKGSLKSNTYNHLGQIFKLFKCIVQNVQEPANRRWVYIDLVYFNQ